MKRPRSKGVFVCSSSHISEPVLNQVNSHFSKLAKSKRQRFLDRWNYITKATAVILLAAMFAVSCTKDEAIQPMPESMPKPSTVFQEYAVKVIDEHEVQLINNSDTVKLYLENATVLYDERIIFVTKQ